MSAASVNNNDCLTKFIDFIPEPVVIIDNQKKIGKVNHSAWRLSGHIKDQRGKVTTFAVILPIELKAKIGGEQFE